MDVRLGREAFHRYMLCIENNPARNGQKRLPVQDPYPDAHVFGPPGSGSRSISQRYGSDSFYHQEKIVRKTLIPTVL